jgi:hypothetical protein
MPINCDACERLPPSIVVIDMGTIGGII